MKNTEKARNPNADQRSRKVSTYSHRSSAEGRRRSLDRFKLMQRPRSRKTRCSVTAAELERLQGCERKKMKKGKSEERPGRAYL